MARGDTQYGINLSHIVRDTIVTLLTSYFLSFDVHKLRSYPSQQETTPGLVVRRVRGTSGEFGAVETVVFLLRQKVTLSGLTVRTYGRNVGERKVESLSFQGK